VAEPQLPDIFLH